MTENKENSQNIKQTHYNTAGHRMCVRMNGVRICEYKTLKLTKRTKQYGSGAFNYIMKVLDTGSVALNFIF